MKISKRLFIAYGVLFICLIISLVSGRYELSLNDILAVLSGSSDDAMAVNVFYNVRLPRSIHALICGMALSVAGLLYRSCFRNPLVSPDTLGVSGGASIGAISAILFFSDSLILRQGMSFVGGLLAVAFSLLLARLIGDRERISLLLAGVITSALTNSAIMALKYLADPTTQLAVIDYWLMGSFSLINRTKMMTSALIALPVLFLCVLLRHRLKVLLIEEDEARSLGIDVRKLFFLCVVLSTLLTASTVCTSGIVSWIGLLAPHIVTILFHTSFEDTLLLAMPVGGAILLLSDVLARSLTMAEIPISIITSFASAIALIVFLIARRRKA